MSSFVAFESRRISLAAHSRSSFTPFVSVCVHAFLSLSFGEAVGDCQREVQVLGAGFRAGAHRWCRVLKKVFTSRAR
jgi:hypothetical protein